MALMLTGPGVCIPLKRDNAAGVSAHEFRALLHLLKTEQPLQFRKGIDHVIRLQLHQMLTGKRGRNRNDPTTCSFSRTNAVQ